MSDRTVIRRERPDQPEVVALLADLDAYLGSLYEPGAKHLLDVQALLETGRRQVQAVPQYKSCGHAPCAAFAGCPDNGLSVFYAQAL